MFSKNQLLILLIFPIVFLFSTSFILFYFIFIYLFLAVLGLRFCARAFSSCGKRGPLFIAVRGPLTLVASPAAEHRLQTRRLGNCGSRAQLLRGMCDLPRPGLEPVSPAWAGRFSTTAPPGKPLHFIYWCSSLYYFFPYAWFGFRRWDYWYEIFLLFHVDIYRYKFSPKQCLAVSHKFWYVSLHFHSSHSIF